MNEHDVQITSDDVQSVVAKMRILSEGLTPAEQAAMRLILTLRAEQGSADRDVEGHLLGIILDLSGIIPSGGEPIVRDHRSPRPIVRDHRR